MLLMIIKNSAECLYCGEEIESTHRHDFRVHTCAARPMPERAWVNNILVEVPDKTTWSFAVDGGKEYLRRCGEGFRDTSITVEDDRGAD